MYMNFGGIQYEFCGGHNSAHDNNGAFLHLVGEVETLQKLPIVSCKPLGSDGDVSGTVLSLPVVCCCTRDNPKT